MDGINTWWRELPGERFWLGITGSDGKCDVLAAPCGSRQPSPTWSQPLISYVREGDAVFQYDEERQAIVSWSTARGNARKRRLFWSSSAAAPGAEPEAPRPLLSWSVPLDGTVPLDGALSLARIAPVQWELFPALRAFEDRVGEPLYYPFDMRSATAATLHPGYVFKLPALFVRRFPELVKAAGQMRWSQATGEAPASGALPGAPAPGTAGRLAPAALRVPRLATR